MDNSYEALRKRLEQFPISCVSGPGILEFLEIILTEEEAEMLSHFKSFQRFLTIEQFARENHLNHENVSKIFQELATRNLIRFEEKKGKEYYCIHPFVIGLYEAFFSSWKFQDQEKLLPAAKAAEKYFRSCFHKAAANSKSPWARILPPVKEITTLLEKYPNLGEISDDAIKETGEHLKRSAALMEYGVKEFQKRMKSGGLSEALDLVKNDGPEIVNSITKSISSLFSFNKNNSQSRSSQRLHKQKPSERREIDIEIEQDITSMMKIHPYEVITNYINEASDIIILPCSCRKHNQILDQDRDSSEKTNCSHDVEDTCMQFRYDGQKGHEYNMMGGHSISKEEAIKILEKCEKQGLVHTTFNSKEKVDFICNCCPCCCGILGTLMQFNHKYSAFVESNFKPKIYNNNCKKCGLCVRKCPTKAIVMEKDEFPIISDEECIGCGICSSNCPHEAIKLLKVKEHPIALDTIDAHVKFANNKIE